MTILNEMQMLHLPLKLCHSALDNKYSCSSLPLPGIRTHHCHCKISLTGNASQGVETQCGRVIENKEMPGGEIEYLELIPLLDDNVRHDDADLGDVGIGDDNL